MTNAPDSAPVAPEQPDETPAAEQPIVPQKFEDLSLSEVLGHFVRDPLRTWSGLSRVLTRPVSVPAEISPADAVVVQERKRASRTSAEAPIDWRALAPLALMGFTFLIALLGSLIFSAARGPDTDRVMPIGGMLLIVGALGTGVVAAYTIQMPRLLPLPATAPTVAAQPSQITFARSSLRLLLLVIAVIWTLGAWTLNKDNQFTSSGVFCWVMSVLSWTSVLTERQVALRRPREGVLSRVVKRLRQPFTFRVSWTLVVLAVILIVGAWFRFTGLHVYPPDMTSDHVEKALDALRVYEGERPVFFPNNGGREGFQMYYLAVLKSITGMPIGLELLQVGAGLEGMVMILLAWWMGRAVIGEEDRRLGNLVGLIMAAMVAISFWHVLLSRLGLRIVTTTLVTTVVFVFLVRALRYNRRSDYLITGLALGAGMYFYQAIRMLPLAVIAGFVVALILRVRSRRDLGRYILNLVALVIVAVAVFVPLGRYMTQYPQVFWERTSGRLFGEEGIQDPAKAIENFRKNLPELTSNLGKSLLMFNVRGDMSWFNGAPDGTPELDFFAGALFAVGLGLVAVRMFRRRDPADWLLPIGIVIMVLPSALAIAYAIEVPSLTRASGALPMVYFVAALPLALLLRMAQQRLPGKWPLRIVYGLVAVCMAVATLSDANSYFVNAMSDYRNSTLPHTEAGQILRGFAESVGAPGNVFLPAYANWFDYRALAIEAGDPHWANIIWRDPDPAQNFIDLLGNNIGTPYVIQPDRQLLFFVNPSIMAPEDQVFVDFLKRTFPDGQTMHVSAYKPERDFDLYIVPPVGCDWVKEHVGRLPVSCQGPEPINTPAPQ